MHHRYSSTTTFDGHMDSGRAAARLKIRAVLVDDDPVYRDMVLTLLTRRFPAIDITMAGDAETAFPIIESLEPDLVFLDVQLPGLNGIKLAGKIKALNAGIRIVMLSNSDLPEYRHAAFRQGASTFISKGSGSCTSEICKQVETLYSAGA